MAMSAAAAQPGNDTKSDMDQLKADVAALRQDFASLAATSRRLAEGELKKQSKRARAFAGTAAKEAETYRDVVADKVKDHPFASVGAAVLVGLALSALSRR